jgi:hypothetical protein
MFNFVFVKLYMYVIKVENAGKKLEHMDKRKRLSAK